MSIPARDKLAELDALYYEWVGCQRCHCSKFRSNIVFGHGNPDAKVMIVGEAPWKQDDISGKPFMGQSGMILDAILSGVSLNKELSGPDSTDDPDALRELLLAEYYYCNLIMCLPGPLENGVVPPSAAAVRACLERLMRQIIIVDPKVIVAVGVTAAKVLLGRNELGAELRGEINDIRIPGETKMVSYPMFTIFHPSYLVRQGIPLPGGEFDETFNYMLKVWEIVDLLDFQNDGTPRPKRHPYVPITPAQMKDVEAKKAKLRAARKSGIKSDQEAEGGIEDEEEEGLTVEEDDLDDEIDDDDAFEDEED